MQGYWVTFTDKTSGYCQGENASDAVRIAESLTGKTAVFSGSKWNPEVPTLPYPADPVIWQLDHPVHGKTPKFCYTPKRCVGRTSCPNGPACTE